MAAGAQRPLAPDPPDSSPGPFMRPAMMRVVPYADEMHASPAVEAEVSYSCYRIGRCSACHLYRFRDRPNRLTRLAPEAPPETVEPSPSIQYLWVLSQSRRGNYSSQISDGQPSP